MRFRFIGAVSLLFLAACATPPPVKQTPTPPAAAVAPSTPTVSANNYNLQRLSPDDVPTFIDDGDTDSLRTAALQSLAYYQSLPSYTLFTVSADTYSAREMANSMEAFVGLLDTSTTRDALNAQIRQAFWVYASAGSDHHGTVTFLFLLRTDRSGETDKE